MEYRISKYTNLLVEVDAYLPEQKPTKFPQNPTPIEHIGLLFTIRYRRSRFDVSANGERRLVWDRESPKLPLCDHQFRSEIFNRGDNSLFQYLSCSFQNFVAEIDAEPVADALIERWSELRDDVNSVSSEKVFPMRVNLTLWYVEARYRIGDGEECGMIPACGGAVTKMLKRVEMVEDGNCVICLDELKKKKKNGDCALQMLCLHVFHRNCIEEWLKNSHYCPICRFQMPISENEDEH